MSIKSLFFWVCTVAILFTGCCDQTFIIYKGETIPVNLNREVHEYHHYNQSSVIEVPEVSNQASGIITEEYNNQASGMIGYDQVVDISNPDQRMVTFHITADYPYGSIVADILIDGRSVPSNSMVDTGSHSYRSSKIGYETIEDTIPASTSDYDVSKQLVALAREVRFRFTDAKTGKAITPTEVKIGLQKIQDGDKVKPCNKTLSVSAQGYQDYEESYFNLPVGIGPFELKKALIPEAKAAPVKAKKIELQLQITSDYNEDEEVPVDKVYVDGKQVSTGSSITPGSHKVSIKYPGFEEYEARFDVPSSVSIYVLKAVLIALPRPLDIDIQYDIYPSRSQESKLGDCKVYLQKKYSDEIMTVKTGDKVKPGTYLLQVVRKAYNNVEKQLRIWPEVSPFAIHVTMEAKNRVVQADISFDKDATNNLGDLVIDFIDVDTQIRRNVKQGGVIKPGKYQYIVSLPGFEMEGGARPITIEPDEEAFEIKTGMKAAARQVSFEGPYLNNVHVRPIEILINGETYRFEKKYYPGKYRIEAKFSQQPTIHKDVTIAPGVGTYVINLNF